MISDLRYQAQASETGQLLERMHGKVWVQRDPAVQPMLPVDRKKRGRSPVHTRYRRLPETAQRDREALQLRLAGYKYREIAAELGYASRQAAHLAAQRGLHDQVTQSRVAKVHLGDPGRKLPSPPPLRRLPAKERKLITQGSRSYGKTRVKTQVGRESCTLSRS